MRVEAACDTMGLFSDRCYGHMPGDFSYNYCSLFYLSSATPQPPSPHTYGLSYEQPCIQDELSYEYKGR